MIAIPQKVVAGKFENPAVFINMEFIWFFVYVAGIFDVLNHVTSIIDVEKFIPPTNSQNRQSFSCFV